MDYEKNYNEALNRARQFMNEHPTRAEADLMVALFPELAESEDEKIIKAIIGIIKNSNVIDINISQEKMLSWLEKQREQEQEWSERDEKILASAMSHIADSQCFDHFHDVSKEDIYTWLKSLRTKSHWKPSEEQMEALKIASTNPYFPAKQFDILVSLYEQLKKL